VIAFSPSTRLFAVRTRAGSIVSRTLLFDQLDALSGFVWPGPVDP